MSLSVYLLASYCFLIFMFSLCLYMTSIQICPFLGCPIKCITFTLNLYIYISGLNNLQKYFNCGPPPPPKLFLGSPSYAFDINFLFLKGMIVSWLANYENTKLSLRKLEYHKTQIKKGMF